MFGELFVESGGHDGDVAGEGFFDIVFGDALLLIDAGDEDNFGVGFAVDDAVISFASVGDDGDRFVTADQASAGEDDSFEQISFFYGFWQCG